MSSALILLAWIGTVSQSAWAWKDFPQSPASEYIEALESGLDSDFCAKWNPEFAFRGSRCCPKPYRVRSKAGRCAPMRVKSSFCDEMTEEQKKYTELAEAGKLGDVLDLIDLSLSKRETQAYCTVNTGFLAWGRRLIPSGKNRVQLRAPGRCLDFGTDPMIGMLEWTGRKIADEFNQPEHSGVKLLVGDISAPRGGCLPGRGGKRGHASHTSGQDVDLGFLHVRKGASSPVGFSRDFDAKQNWWLIKQIFKNPYACVKVIFLDRRHISKLGKVAAGDPDWTAYRKFIRHVKFHRNHLHVRIGDGPGAPGCVPGANPELELLDEDSEPENGPEIKPVQPEEPARSGT